MNNDFLIVSEVKKFILELDNILINFPKKDIIIKQRIKNDSLFLLENIYEANNTSDKEIKRNIKSKCLTKIYIIDYYFEYCYKKNYISLKVFNHKVNQLTKITKMIYGWIKYEEL